MLEADTDCLHVIEVKAGMDLLRLNQAYDERLSFIGGIDMRVLYNNDHREVDAELVAKIPPGQRSSRFCAALRPFHPQQHSTRDLPLLH